MGTEFSFRTRRMGSAAGAALAFNPITAGISAGVGLATSGVAMWLNSIQQSHMADTGTTLIVNGLAEQLQNLKDAYFAERNPTCADQRAALNAYDNAWMWLQSPQACGNPEFGSAGNRCITDRAPGGKFPWAQYYRDPIAADPRLGAAGCDTGREVVLPTLNAGYQTTGITSTGGSSATGASAADLGASAVAAGSIPPAAAAGTIAGIPTAYLAFGLLGIGALALVNR